MFSLHRRLIACLLLALSLVASRAEASPPCRAVELLQRNINARQSVREYGQPNFRSLDLVAQILNWDPSTMKAGDVLIDCGGGYGIAALELSREKGVISHVINAQNNYAALMDVSERLQRVGARSVSFLPTLNTIASIDGFNPQVFDALAQALGMVSPGLASKYPDAEAAWQKALTEVPLVLSEVRNALRAGKFNYHPGYAEEVLPKLTERADRLIDMWGAYPYSAARIELLEMYYRSLAPEGMAYILVPSKLNTWVLASDSGGIPYPYRTAVEGGMAGPLTSYLLHQFPRVFDLLPSVHLEYKRSIVLRMKRDPQIEDLRIPLTISSLKPPPAGEALTTVVYRETLSK